MSSPIREEWQSADGQHTILLGDCLEILPTLDTSEVAAVLADPPYGIDYENAGGFAEQCGWVRHEKTGWDVCRPTQEAFDTILAIGKAQIIWGGNYFADMLPPKMRWLIWDKGQTGFTLADCEMAWTSQNQATRRITIPRGVANREERLHWTQKPVALMIWCLSFLPPGLILDPFAGSCTVAVACARTGRRSISIEIEERYFRIGIERMEREAARTPLFEQARHVQKSLL